MPYGNQQLEWKIGDPGANAVCDKNARLIDAIFDRLTKRCGNPFCGWPISAIGRNFATPEHGDVCATCHDLHNALTMANPHLKSTMYFRAAHNEWLKENDPAELKKWRKKLGLDGNNDAT